VSPFAWLFEQADRHEGQVASACPSANSELKSIKLSCQIARFRTAETTEVAVALLRQNGGSACGYQAIFVPLAALTSPGYSPMGGQPAVYLYIAALQADARYCREARTIRQFKSWRSSGHRA